jgi:folate-binding protein YgfZ
MITTFRHFKRRDEHYLQMPRETIAPTLRRLGMFVLRDRTVLADASDTLARFGLSGPDADTLLEAMLSAVPSKPDNVVQVSGITIIRVPGVQPRFEIHGEPRRLGELWSTLAESALAVGAESWHLLDIRAGIPWIYSSTSESFVPQMTNLQLLDGVSFRKGCYVGQEIVARTQHLGKLKRRMYHARINRGERPLPGDDLFVSGIGQDQIAGTIVDICQSPGVGDEVLAVILIEHALSGSVHLGNVDGPLLDVQPLVYALEESTLSGPLE